MGEVIVGVAGRKINSIVRDVEEYAENGYDVILELGEDPSPERIIKILKATAGKYKIDLTIRHAELEEYIECALTGAAAGGLLAGAAAVLTAVASGVSLPLKVFLSAVGTGAAIGGILGLCSTPIAEVKVYKFRGETRIKFISENS